MLTETERPAAVESRTRRWFRAVLLGVFVVGLAVRLASVIARPHLAAGGDPAEYVGQANLLAQGKGWIEPFVYERTGAHLQTAKLPPLFTLLMAVCSVAGFKSFFAHRIWSAILGAAAVPVAYVFGREVSGRRVGMIAAILVAVYPNLWVSDGLAMSETISPVLAMAVLWTSYRLWRSPSLRRAAAVGVLIGLAALARDELALLGAFVFLPIVALIPGRTRVERLRLASVGVAGAIIVVAPWVGFNLARFSHPVLISDRFGVTVAAANCDVSWHGPLRGYWSMGCAAQSAQGVHGDESAVDPVALRHGVKYVTKHIGGVPGIEAVRLGRTFGFYHPLAQVELDSFVEGRPHFWALTGLAMYYLFAGLALAGGWILRRSGVPIFPMVAVAADVVVAVLLTYGQTRFRATLEPVLVVLSAVALSSVWHRLRPAPASIP